ncbi:MAG: DNA repair protein RecO [Planctomycetota bacterium]|nr:MAG: DNA repair protein RecO [Planctomycetota bacterium]
MLTRDQAICLRTVDYSETSQVVTLFAKDSGKIAAIAKGAKRPKSPFEGAIEVFSFGDIVYAPARTGNLATLTEFEQRPVFMPLRTKPAALNCALFAAELLDAFMQQDDTHSELFDSFYRFLCDVQQSADDFGALGLLVLFQLTLLNEIGTRPVLARCANCNTAFDAHRPKAYFSSTANGLICCDCEQTFADKIRLAKDAARCLNELKLIKTASRPTMNEIEKVLIYHFTALMHHPPKMAKHFLKGI